MAQQKELQTVIKLLGKVDPSLGRAIGEADSKFANFATGAGRVGGIVSGAMVAATAAVAAFAIDSVKKFGEFEVGLNKIATIADLLILSMDDIKDGALETSSVTGFVVDKITEAQYQYISATGDTEGSIKATLAAAKLAKGGFAELDDAMDGVTSTMNTYGVTGEEEFTRISDIMINTQNVGKTTVAELSKSLGGVSPIAVNMGIAIEETSAGIAVLTTNGIQTSEAATGLKAALSNIIKPSQEATEAASILGIEFSASAVESMGFGTWLEHVKTQMENAAPAYMDAIDKNTSLRTEIENLSEKTDKLSKSTLKDLQKELKQSDVELETLSSAAESPVSGFSKLFGSTEALNTMLVLLSDTGFGKYNSALASMYESSGATQKAFDQMQVGISAKWGLFTNKLTVMQIKLGDKLAEPFMSMAESLFPLIEEILPQLFDALVPIVEAVLPALTQVLAAILPPISSFIKEYSPVLVKFLGALKPLLDPLSEVLTMLLNNVVLPLLSAWVTFIDLIAPALEIAVGVAAGYFEKFSTIVGKVADAFKAVFDWIGKVLGKWGEMDEKGSLDFGIIGGTHEAEAPSASAQANADRFFADGGIATVPSTFGEAGAEMAIPLSRSKRSRAMELLKQTQNIIGGNTGDTFNVSFSIHSNQDPDEIADSVFKRMQSYLASQKRRNANNYV